MDGLALRADRDAASAIMAGSKAFTVIMGAAAIGLVLLSVLFMVHVSAKGPAAGATAAVAGNALENYTYSIGMQAYIYGLAPVIMERTEQQFATTQGMGHAPVNQFGFSSELATPNSTIFVSPNADTLYNSAWLELGKGPMVLHVPDTNGRYYVEELLDAYTNNFNSIGRRLTGTGEGDYAIVGPGWNGTLPPGVKAIRSPTNTTWIVGRILVNGKQDLPDVLALQKQFTLTPLSQFGKHAGAVTNLTPADFSKAMPSPDAMPDLKFFEELRVALKNNPPPAGEAALMAVFSQIGLLKNDTPYGQGMNAAVVRGLTRALQDGDQIVTAAFANPQGNKDINGWSYSTDVGTYGYNYIARAAVAQGGLAANVPEESVYPKAQVDSDGRPLTGANNYVMHFDKGNLPPVDAFWSLTIYNATTYMLVPNAIGRYAIGDRTSGMKYNSDGSLDIYVRHNAPAGNESNWLPAPQGELYLILRMYQPRPEVVNGTYQIPPVKRAQ
jgi:hypothetical protein